MNYTDLHRELAIRIAAQLADTLLETAMISDRQASLLYDILVDGLVKQEDSTLLEFIPDSRIE